MDKNKIGFLYPKLDNYKSKSPTPIIPKEKKPDIFKIDKEIENVPISYLTHTGSRDHKIGLA